MSGIYIHIPFCEKKCSYCDFHFSTRLDLKAKMVEMICRELELRKDELWGQTIETIYFGGGTPSLLTEAELNAIFESVYSNYPVDAVEITLEANPDDLSKSKINELKKSGINRLSIGVQSFFDEDLQLMNRIHSAKEAEESILLAQDAGLDNISIDLIYGSPTTSNERWQFNLDKALSLQIPHVSSYALTVEPKTLLNHQIVKGLIKPIDEEKQFYQFEMLCNTLKANGFIQYEISNFGKENYFAVHNSSYWKGSRYIGIGPSAHSYDGKTRSWNISNNSQYIKSIENGGLPSEQEILTETEKYNEYIMIGLRTIWGIDNHEIKNRFSQGIFDFFEKESAGLIKSNQLIHKNNRLVISDEFKFHADGTASKLFWV